MTVAMHPEKFYICLRLSSWNLYIALQYKDRVDYRLIKPAVDWRKAGVQDATNKAAVASQ